LAAADEQKKPAVHGFAPGETLPGARQRPAAQVMHEPADVYVGPPSECVPRAHGFAAAEPVPAGQKWPAGHAFWLFTVDTVAQ
jgi:hypothetical protein